jgi:GT2 family glycosyltransferase
VNLSIIFVNRNSTDYLQRCITSIYEWTNSISFEIIVVDNASTTGDVDVLKRQFDRITLLKITNNLGFARANNLGFRHSSGEFVLFLNPDTELISAAIDTLLRHLGSLPDAGIIGCRLLNGDLSLQGSCIQTFPTILNQALDADCLRNRWPRNPLWGMAPLFTSSSKPARVEAISGACMLIRRRVFEQVGMFDENYFMYAEDVDLCYKAERAGYRNYFVGEATIIHYGGKSTPPQWATAKKWESILRYCLTHRGRFYTLVFRFVMTFAALGRLAIIALLSLLRKRTESKDGSHSPSAKWSAILKTLLRSPLSTRTIRDVRS